MNEETALRRGDVVIVQLDPAEGHEANTTGLTFLPQRLLETQRTFQTCSDRRTRTFMRLRRLPCS
jgi:hypothetical protein